REHESRILASALARESVVIATGGGVIEEERNRSALNSAIVIWLRAPAAVLASRLQGQVARPLLGNSPREDLERFARRRESLYAAVANFRVDAEDSPPEVLRRILAELRRLRIVS
ncbi:MAG TPA: shikimate kinase, partial [Gammaproteobacteria bacterium]|nr:shikimate kinase [Gammaproteobacteria bacterium]